MIIPNEKKADYNNYYSSHYEEVMCVKNGRKGIHAETYPKQEAFEALFYDNCNYQMDNFYQDKYIRELEKENKNQKQYIQKLESENKSLRNLQDFVFNYLRSQLERNLTKYYKSEINKHQLIKILKETSLFLIRGDYVRNEVSNNLLNDCRLLLFPLLKNENDTKTFQKIPGYLDKPDNSK